MGLTVLKAETLTSKEKKKKSHFLGEMAKADIEERETKKIPISLRILTKIKGKMPKFQASFRISIVLVLVYAFLGFVLVFFAFFWFVAIDSLVILGFHVVLNISMSS